MKKSFLLLLLVFSILCSYAQRVETEVHISKMKITVDVVGAIAFTTYDIELYNPEDKYNNQWNYYNLTLFLALNEIVVDHKLDIKGKLRSGVVINKNYINNKLNQIERSLRNPKEKKKESSNNYKLRIYPIYSESYSRTVITTQQVMPLIGGQYIYMFVDPLREICPKFNLEVYVHDISTKPKIKETTLKNFKFSSDKKSYRASYCAENYSFKESLIFTIPQNKKVTTFTQRDKNSVKWFYSTFPKINRKNKEHIVSENIAIIWDNSLSGLSRNLEKEIELLREFINRNTPKKIDLITFGDELSKTKSFTDVDKLYSYLIKMKYDGRSDITLLNKIKGSWNRVLLFSDGISSLNEESSPLSLPLVAVISCKNSNLVALNRLGAEIVNINKVNISDAIDIINGEVNRVKSVTQIAGDFNCLSLKEGDIISNLDAVYGSFEGDNAKLKVDFTNGETIVIKINESTKNIDNFDSLSNYTTLARLWATDEINKIAIQEGEESKSKIVDLAVKYGVITKYTSLIVLESITEYINYGVIIPEELKTDEYYMQLKSKKRDDREKVARSREGWVIDQDIESYYLKLIDWWKNDRKRISPILLRKDKNIAIRSNIAESQQQVVAGEMVNISGTVYDENGIYLDYILLMVRDFGVVRTDHKGEYSFDVPVGSYVDILHYVSIDGFSFSFKVVEDQKIYNVVMEYDKNIMVIEDLLITSPLYSSNYYDPPSNILYSTSSFVLKEWSLDESYIKVLQKYDNAEELYNQYFKIRHIYHSSPQFYIYVADRLRKKGDLKKALKVLGNLVEISTDDLKVVNNYAQKLIEYCDYNVAVKAFQYGMVLRPGDLYALRDLAMALELNGEFQRALDTYYDIMNYSLYRSLFNLKSIVFTEINSLISRYGHKLDTSKIDKRLICEMPVNMRIVVSSGSYNCNIKLYVVEPSLEECSDKNRLTLSGGRISSNPFSYFTHDEYVIKNPVEGTYIIKVDYQKVQKLILPVYVYADIYTDYATKEQKHERIIVRVDSNGGMCEIGRVKVGK